MHNEATIRQITKQTTPDSSFRIMLNEIDALRAIVAEVINLCAVGDVDETTKALGWGAVIRRAKNLVPQRGVVGEVGRCECGASYYRAEEVGQPCSIQYCRGTVKTSPKRGDV